MKRYSVSLIVKEMQIKSQWDITTHSFNFRITKIKRMSIPSIGKVLEELSYTVGDNIKWYYSLAYCLSKTLHVHLTWVPAILFFILYNEKMKQKHIYVCAYIIIIYYTICHILYYIGICIFKYIL